MIKDRFKAIKNKEALFYAVFVMIVGIIISFMLPIGQTPDELVHFKQMCNAYGFNYVYDQYSTEIYNYNLVESAFSGEKIDRARLSDVMSARFDKSVVTVDFKPGIMMISYVPQIIGFCIGFFLNMPIWLCVWLAEFFNLLFAAFTGYLALKYMPCKKHMLMAVMLFPMCIHQYASINYDAVLLPLCFLLFSLCLYFKAEAKEVKTKHVIAVIAVALVIAAIKPPYALIGVMALTIPYEKVSGLTGKFLKAIQSFPLISAIIIITLGSAAIFVLKDQRYISLIAASLVNPVHYLRLIRNTITSYFEFFYISTIGSFGYLSMPLPKIMVIAIYIFIVMTGITRDNSELKIKKREKLLYLLCCFIILNMVFIAMISHSFLISGLEYGPLQKTLESYVKINQIEGIQGRYFIPVLPLILICFNGIKVIPEKVVRILEIIYYIAVPLSMVIIIGGRLW